MKQILLILSLLLAMTAIAKTPAPSPSLRKDGKFYEMRIYHAAPGKLEDLHKRFRDHTIKLFKKHGMEIVGFYGPTDKEDGSDTKLIYILGYPSREAREASWKAFGADEVWKAARTASEVNGKLVDKVESIYMNATDYAGHK
jgi:hypothetical protein